MFRYNNDAEKSINSLVFLPNIQRNANLLPILRSPKQAKTQLKDLFDDKRQRSEWTDCDKMQR